MKTYISVITSALLLFFQYTCVQAADQATGLITDEVELVNKIRIPVNTSDGKSQSETSPTDSKYGEVFVLASTMMRYELIEQTIITDATGTAFTPDQLRTPCTVKMVAQRLTNGYYNAQEIVVKSCSSHASNSWLEQPGK